jgi:hypothetical protein
MSFSEGIVYREKGGFEPLSAPPFSGKICPATDIQIPDVKL